eukprot:scaffold648309_cov161-Attheya_sp.AAC.1
MSARKEEVGKHYLKLLNAGANKNINLSRELDKYLITRNHLQLFVKMFNHWANTDGSSTSSQLSSFRLPRFESLALSQFQFYFDTDAHEQCFVCRNCKKTF